MYSLPPLQLAWRGWGELDNALLGGLLLHLYGYAVLGGRISLEVATICIPFTLLAFNNLLATTWADREADAQVGKNTLATRLTIPQLCGLYAIVAVAAFTALPFLQVPREITFGSFLALPMVLWGW